MKPTAEQLLDASLEVQKLARRGERLIHWRDSLLVSMEANQRLRSELPDNDFGIALKQFLEADFVVKDFAHEAVDADLNGVSEMLDEAAEHLRQLTEALAKDSPVSGGGLDSFDAAKVPGSDMAGAQIETANQDFTGDSSPTPGLNDSSGGHFSGRDRGNQ